jgi:hypothetical protein
MRRLTILLAAALSVGFFAPLASSAAPVMERTVSGAFTVAAESCGFPVTVEPRHDQLRIFTFSSGRQILTGSYLATATGNGKSLSINLSGQGSFTPNSEGGGTFVSTGATLFFLPGSLQLIHGPIVFEFDPEGNADITIVSSSVTDVCAILADP